VPPLADLTELLATTYNYISVLHQLPCIYHPRNVRGVAGLQIVRAIVLAIGTLAIHVLGPDLVCLEQRLSTKPTRYSNSDIPPCTNIDLHANPSHACPLYNLSHPFRRPPRLYLIGPLLLLVLGTCPLPVLNLLTIPPQKCTIAPPLVCLELYPLVE
jgi:hypothetical protein